jgi:hypothetical protein
VTFATGSAQQRKAPEINLGDLFRAMNQLRTIDTTTRDAIARLLGYELPADGAQGSGTRRSGGAVLPLDLKRGSSAPVSSLEDIRRRSRPRRPADSPGKRLIPHQPPTLPGNQVDNLLRGPALTIPDVANTAVTPPARPLLDPKTVRSIIFFALATVAHEGEIDVEALSRFLSFEQEWSGRLPRLPRSTLRLGVHVVFDRRPAMVPFYRDQNSLFEIISSVVGIHRTTYSNFRSSPEEVLSPKPSLLARESFPKPDIPTLLLSDLGIGSSFDFDGVPLGVWIEFVNRLRKAGSPVVAFVPYSPQRWPAALRRSAALICWDRPTTPSLVRRRVGIGHEIKSEY